MKVTINVPTSLQEITLRQYQEFVATDEPTAKDVFRIFLGINEDAIDKIPAYQVETQAAHIISLFEPEQGFIQKFTLNGKRYGFITNLDQISYGENHDINKFMGDWKTMHLAMQVMYRPITLEKGGKYLIEEYNHSEEEAERMRSMPVSVVLGATVFFYNLLNELLICIPNFLQRELTKEQLLTQVSLENGESTTNSTRSLMEILDDLKRLQKLPYTLASTT